VIESTVYKEDPRRKTIVGSVVPPGAVAVKNNKDHLKHNYSVAVAPEIH
jgi:hypothetical protein